jgi:hypothetical protein
VRETDPVVKRTDYAEAAAMLRRLLAAVAADELEAKSAHATALVRRIEGAAVAFEAVSKPTSED